MASWALVLGASSGFGAATCRALVQAGRPVCGVHLDRGAARARADALAQELASSGLPVLFFNRNAARQEVREAVLASLREQLAPGDEVGVLVHSLAFGSLLPLVPDQGEGLSARQVQMTTEVMGHSLAWWTRDLVQGGLMGQGGRVIALTSEGARRVLPTYGALSVAKASLEAWVRQLAVELAPRGITANALQPGVCPTPSLHRIPDSEALLQRASQSHPAGRLTTPEDVAAAVVALTSPGTAWMTGNVIRVDGGEALV